MHPFVNVSHSAQWAGSARVGVSQLVSYPHLMDGSWQTKRRHTALSSLP